jgi:hypothetical protein
MKEELANQHRRLKARFDILKREYDLAMLGPTIRKWRGLSEVRESHIVWPELSSIILEMDMIALHFYGANIGDPVRLIGKRYGGTMAKIEGVEVASWYGLRFSPLGRKPRIAVRSPRGSRPVLISGSLWELATQF